MAIVTESFPHCPKHGCLIELDSVCEQCLKDDVRVMVDTIRSDRMFGPYEIHFPLHFLNLTADRRVARRWARRRGGRITTWRGCKPRLYEVRP